VKAWGQVLARVMAAADRASEPAAVLVLELARALAEALAQESGLAVAVARVAAVVEGALRFRTHSGTRSSRQHLT
jgi:hypothetical protein